MSDPLQDYLYAGSVLADYASMAPVTGANQHEEALARATWVEGLSTCPHDGAHAVSLSKAKTLAAVVRGFLEQS
jgi:hypothetical protein